MRLCFGLWTRCLAMSLLLAGGWCAGADVPDSAAAPLLAAENGVALLPIVHAADAPPPVRHAAEELQRFLGEMSGARFSLRTDDMPLPDSALLVGPNRYLEGLGVAVEGLGPEAYLLRTVGTHLVVVGGAPRGTLYGVYALLEEHLGCRWFTPEISRIPEMRALWLPGLAEQHAPVLMYREPYVFEGRDGDWAARNRMNSSGAALEARHGGKVAYKGFVHTFEELVPPETYFETHPEYFSLVNGQREKYRSQLCNTNPEVARIVTDTVREWMRTHPEATVFSVSPNDWWNPCECTPCATMAAEEGSEAGPLLYLVNQVAAAVAEEFPGKLIDTLAYQYTRTPPRTIRPLPNVVVRLCSIECCFAHPFDACDSEENKAFVEDVIGWGRIAPRLWVWDYVTSFDHYLLPFPNLRVRGANIRFLVENNVTGIFEQDVYQTPNGEFSGLSGYLNAKLLWNPEYDEGQAITEFLEGVYGAAAVPLGRYLDLLHDLVEAENLHIGIREGPGAAYLKPEIMRAGDALFDEAEAAVAQDAALLERVRIARLSLDYAIIEQGRRQALSLFAAGPDGPELAPEFAARLRRFLDAAARGGVTHIAEAGGEMGAYRAHLEHLLALGSTPFETPESLDAPRPGISYGYYEGSWHHVPDFSTLDPVRTGVAEGIGIEHAARLDLFGMHFEGYLRIPEDGLYLFALSSNDGSKLYLNNRLFIDHDGLHGMIERTGVAALQAGYHRIEIGYFESAGREGLLLEIEGPGLPRQPVPASMLWHQQWPRPPLVEASAAGDAGAEITNRWGAAQTVRLETQEVIVQGAVEGRSYHHHCHTASLAPFFYAIFSSGVTHEDDVGQQVYFTRSEDDGVTWSTPRRIVDPPQGEFAQAVATATGLYAYQEEGTGIRRLVAYHGLYEYAEAGLAGGVRKPRDAAHQHTRCMLVYSEDDGVTWSEPRLVAERVVANLGPQRLASGRLVMPANVVYLYSDDPTGLTGWMRTGLPGVPEDHADDSAGFARLFDEDPVRFGYCEGSLFQTAGGAVHMMLRTNGPQLAVTESVNDGVTWSAPRLTAFSDNASRHQFGRLPDGRYFALSTPDPVNMWSRTPLVIAVSEDGVVFDRHFVVGDAANAPPRFPGHAKGGRYGYPHLSILGETVVVFYSIAKEDVAMCRFPLSWLD